MANQKSKPGVTNNAPYVVVAFQRDVGSALLWGGGCFEVKSVGSESFQTAYEYCRTITGDVIRYDIDQIQDPTPIQVAARGDLVMQQILYNIWKISRERNCGINLLIVQRDCVDQARIKDPNFFTRGFWLYDLRATGRWTFGNDTIVGMNAKSPQLTEDQGQFTVGAVVPFMQNNYSTVKSGLAAGFIALAIGDMGSCASGDCGDDHTGCKWMVGLRIGAAHPDVSYDGGVTWSAMSEVAIASNSAYSLTSVNGRILLQEFPTVAGGTVITRVLTPNATLTSYTPTVATVNGGYTMSDKYVALGVGNKPVVAPDGLLVWGGEDGQVFKSSNNGGVWTRIANNVTATTTVSKVVNFLRMATVNGKLYAIGRDGDNPAADVHTMYLVSEDSGVTWTLAGYTVEAQPTTLKLVAAGEDALVNVNGDIFRWTPSGVGTVAINPTGITNIDEVIPLDERGNNVLIVDDSSLVYRSVDGLATATPEVIGLTAGAGVTSWAMCHTDTDDSVYLALHTNLVKAREGGYLF